MVFPAPPAIDPAFWRPSAEVIIDYQGPGLILLNRADYAKWVAGAALPRRKLVNTSAAFRHRYIRVDDALTHSHGPTGDHSHGGVVFTTWLDFQQAAEQAQAIAHVLNRLRPESEPVFSNNLTALKRDLGRLDLALTATVAKNPGLALLASHPVYQYLGRRLEINLRSLTWEPDETPSRAQWSELAQLLEQHPARWMIWEREAHPEILARLRGLDAVGVVFDPSVNRPPTGDFAQRHAAETGEPRTGASSRCWMR